MLKIVDMSEHTGIKGSFSVWDTVADKFIENKYGEQDFDSFSYFASSIRSENIVSRVEKLIAKKY